MAYNNCCCRCGCNPCVCPPAIEIGTVTTVPSTFPAAVTNTGNGCKTVLNFEIPQGEAGLNGSSATVTIGTTTTGEAGTNAAVTNTGTASNANLNFTIPKGADGNGDNPYGIFNVSVTENENGSLLALTNGAGSTYTLSSNGNEITLAAGYVHLISYTVNATGTTQLGITPLINGTASSPNAQYDYVSSETLTSSVSSTFLRASANTETVSFRVSLPTGTTVTNLQGTISVVRISEV